MEIHFIKDNVRDDNFMLFYYRSPDLYSNVNLWGPEMQVLEITGYWVSDIYTYTHTDNWVSEIDTLSS